MSDLVPHGCVLPHLSPTTKPLSKKATFWHRSYCIKHSLYVLSTGYHSRVVFAFVVIIVIVCAVVVIMIPD